MIFLPRVSKTEYKDTTRYTRGLHCTPAEGVRAKPYSYRCSFQAFQAAGRLIAGRLIGNEAGKVLDQRVSLHNGLHPCTCTISCKAFQPPFFLGRMTLCGGKVMEWPESDGQVTMMTHLVAEEDVK